MRYRRLNLKPTDDTELEYLDSTMFATQSTSSRRRRRRSSLDLGTRTIFISNRSKNSAFKDNRVTNTKYTILTFLPYNLLEQFSRFMNQYFLVIACLQLIPSLTPISPVTTWMPLIFIFAITAIKEALDDYQRHKSDKMANERLYTVLKDGKETTVPSKEIRVGDIVKIAEDSELPCDIVALSSSNEDGCCYVQTSNIDGEMDLKVRFTPKETAALDTHDIRMLRGSIECPEPNSHIYSFDAVLKLDEDSLNTVSLSPNNLLLQGTILRNTDYVYGAVVYTGNETKLGKNKNKPSTKLTNLDKLIDKVCLYVFFSQLLIVVVFGAVGNYFANSEFIGRHSYVHAETELKTWYEYLIIPTRMLLLMSFMIPISLKVTLDMTKYATACFISWDLKMYDSETKQPAVASSTAIAEDLGQIEFIMTDKTGTLTRNQMIFKFASINGELFGKNENGSTISADGRIRQVLDGTDRQTIQMMHEYFRCLALCHSVSPVTRHEPVHGHLYEGTSPDEEALVSAAADVGFKFISRKDERMTIQFLGAEEVYEILHVLEYTSERKRMSVILRNVADDRIVLYAKGADDVILESCKSSGLGADDANMEWFSTFGFRTLCVAYRVLEEDEYESWAARFHQANTSLENREENVQEVYSLIEAGMTFLGITAVEDALQDRVPETIQQLRNAGIRFWMLTGDRRQTAIQVARSCYLLYDDHRERLIDLNIREKPIGEIVRLMNHYIEVTKAPGSLAYTIVIDGLTLRQITDDVETENCFVKLALQSHGVICSRVTPQQKALVVELVKPKYRTLAIGDGGNDVSMIQKAHIGVGIRGREGLQATRASDYSIAKFKYLSRLLLVHGRYTYKRTAFIALYCFYKSIYIGFLQALYEFFSGFSGTSFLNSYALTAYNVFFTGLPIVFYVLDKDLSEKMAVKFPEVYKENLQSIFFNLWVFSSWVFRALFQSSLTIMICIYTLSDLTAVASGGAPGQTLTAMTAFSAGVLIQTFTLIIHSNTITLINDLVLWGSVAIYFLLTYIVSLFETAEMFGTAVELYSNASYWLIIAICAWASIAPFLVMKYYRFNYEPLFYEKIKWLSLTQKQAEDSTDHIEMQLSTESMNSSEQGVPSRQRSNSQDSIQSRSSGAPLL